MRNWKTYLFILGLVVSPLLQSGWADPVEPNLEKLVREAEKPRMQYPPARAGWNGPESTAAQRMPNPIYDSLRGSSAAALRTELLAALKPDWNIVLAFVVLIVGLRMLRNHAEFPQQPVVAVAGNTHPRTHAKILTMPSPGLPAMPNEEAA